MLLVSAKPNRASVLCSWINFNVTLIRGSTPPPFCAHCYKADCYSPARSDELKIGESSEEGLTE